MAPAQSDVPLVRSCLVKDAEQPIEGFVELAGGEGRDFYQVAPLVACSVGPYSHRAWDSGTTTSRRRSGRIDAGDIIPSI